jgi:hypothetical protein
VELVRFEIVSCPLCQKRPTKRHCPARRDEICAVCCATKRLVEISCPEDCRYLDAAQRHPAAVIKKQIDRDLAQLMLTVGRLSEQQLQLFFLLQSMVLSYKPEGLSRLTDTDVASATGALAASLESASKGVIFDEALPSVPAEALRKTVKPILDEIMKNGGSGAERQVAVVLRAMERGAKHEGGLIPDGETTYLELVGRVFQRPAGGRPGSADKPLIVLP